MSGKRAQWIARRGQAGADVAIDQVIEQRPLPGEHIQLLADELITDSPYQARRPFDEQSVEELAQGMRESGFQGVLVVRPHSDPAQRRRGVVQLVYGHRRRVAWRRVCAARGEPCTLPVAIREITDQQLLTIGAQENLQRQDLDPIEEAQIVAWHQQMYFHKNQAELGAMLGKSEDWVKIRSRIHKLPEPLKERLRQRPRAISQILELGALYAREPEAALALADRVIQSQLTLDAVREAVRNYVRPPAPAQSAAREEMHNQGGTTPIVTEGTMPSARRDEKSQQSDIAGELRAPTPGRAASTEERPAPITPLPVPAAGVLSAPAVGAEPPHPWLPQLCDRLLQTTGALRQVRGEISALDHESASQLSSAAEALLRELDLMTRTLGQRDDA